MPYREVGRTGEAGDIDSPAPAERDCRAVFIVVSSQVSTEEQRRPSRIELGNECILLIRRAWLSRLQGPYHWKVGGGSGTGHVAIAGAVDGDSAGEIRVAAAEIGAIR